MELDARSSIPEGISRPLRPRRAAAALLAVFFGPLGHVAIGYWRRACGWYGIEVLLIGAVLAAAYWGRPVVLWGGMLAAWLLRILIIADVLRLPRAYPAPRIRAVVLVGIGAVLFHSMLASRIRSALMETFQLPTAGMYPTLEVGDHFFTRKSPRTFVRGDVVVHRYPLDPETMYVKRIVAIEGDVVEVRLGHLAINGTPIERRQLDEPCSATGAGGKCTLWEETLDGHTWRVAITDDVPYRDFERVRVPVGTVFVLGDNRNNSSDSRVWGPVRVDQVEGKVTFLWLPARSGTFWRRLNQPVR